VAYIKGVSARNQTLIKETPMSKAIETFSKQFAAKLDELDRTGDVNVWNCPWRRVGGVKNAFSNREYTGIYNILTLAMSNFGDTRWATYNQYKKAGGSVKRGEKGTLVIFWTFFTKEDEKTGKEKSIPFAKAYTLFNVEQTEGVELSAPELHNEAVEVDERVYTIYKELGVDSNIEYGNRLSDKASYCPATHKINLPNEKQFDKGDQFVSTAFHELVHWTAHKVDHDLKGTSYAYEELVAEIGACYLCYELGVDNYIKEESLQYVSSWAKSATDKKGRTSVIYKACKDAEARVKYILENTSVKDKEKREVA
jgi:antirestriction protein ArdC